jgi:ribonucleoside-diphosphate reductase alpha chain
MGSFACNIMQQKYSKTKPDGTKETWEEIAQRVAQNVLATINASPEKIAATAKLIAERKFIPGGRYLYASGNAYHQVQNCLLMRVEDSREGWGELLSKAMTGLMSGAGIGVNYSRLRHEGAPIRRTGGVSSGPIALMVAVNEVGRASKQGGDRRAAIWAGLNWKHKDIFKFIHLKDWSEEVRALKAKDFNFPAPMDGTNISVGLDTEFFIAYDNKFHELHDHAHKVYWDTVKQMLKTGEPGFSIDCNENDGEDLRNACTEVSSRDDSDICNLGSINMAQIGSLEEMLEVVKQATEFLVAGTLYSDLPYTKVGEIRDKNRRLGLGLMGLHEWLLKHGHKYGPCEELGKYLEIYEQSGKFANNLCNALGISCPVKTRAIAPTGTIGIIAETSGGLEPIFCVAYKRRYMKGSVWAYQYVIDPAAKRLIDSGVSPDLIEDAYDLAKEPERRVAFQAWLQKYVDHSISSTLNLPEWGTEYNNAEGAKSFGKMLMKHLPSLRGMTVYPDGSRGGQPLTPVKLSTALKHGDEVFYETGDICDITKGGTCGS